MVAIALHTPPNCFGSVCATLASKSIERRDISVSMVTLRVIPFHFIVISSKPHQ